MERAWRDDGPSVRRSRHHEHRSHVDSPFDVLDDAFALLVAEPRPLAIDGAEVGCGLPAREISSTG